MVEFTYTPNEVAFWVFRIHSEAVDCRQTREEELRICRTLFDSFDEFIEPTEIDWHLASCNCKDTDASGASTGEGSTESQYTIKNVSRITFEELKSSVFQTRTDHTKISFLKIKNANTRIYLDGERHPIGRHSDVERDIPPHSDPIVFSLYNTTTDPESPQDYELHIATHTAIWFEDTARGEENKQILNEIFNSITDNLAVEDISYDRSGGPTTTVDIDDNSPPL